MTASISSASSSRVSIEFVEFKYNEKDCSHVFVFKFSLFRTMVQPLASDDNSSVSVSSMLDLDAVDVVITLTGSIILSSQLL